MDDEDLAEAEQSRNLQTTGGFAGLGGTEQDAHRQAGLLDVFRPAEATMGVKLLQKMGWKQGQGIGPRIRRAAREDPMNVIGNDLTETHLFAPDNTKMISFVKKSDNKGLGYGSEPSLSRPAVSSLSQHPSDDDKDDGSSFTIRPKPKIAEKGKVKGGFGMGILNDTGSDDDDPYTMGPKISYNRVIGGDKKKSKKATATKASTSTSNPLLNAKPVFTSKSKGANSGFRKCHDGRLPLEGFVLAIRAAAPQKTYTPPRIPEGWTSKFSTTETEDNSSSAGYVSTSDAAKASSMDPKARATMLGEQQLPGKSIFDFMSSATRDRLAAASGRADLPAAGNEAAPEAFRKSDAEKAKDLRSLLPDLDCETAMQALSHRSMPYAEDESKRRRYRQFLELRAGTRSELPERAKDENGKDVSTDEYVKEMREFVHAAKVFRPMSGMMATRFTSSSTSTLAPDSKDPEDLLSRPAAEKPVDPAEEAAKLGMYGPMTRTVLEFYPTRLVCKRFNVRPPAHVAVDPGGADGNASGATATSTAEPVSRRDMDRMMQDAALSKFNAGSGTGFVSGGTEGGTVEQMDQTAEASASRNKAEDITQTMHSAKVDVEKNEALEGQRPGEELFKAIFGSDDEAE